MHISPETITVFLYLKFHQQKQQNTNKNKYTLLDL